MAPPLSALRIARFVLFLRFLIAYHSSLLTLLFGGFSLLKIMVQSCLTSPLSSSIKFLILSSMQHIRLSTGMEVGEMEKFNPFFKDA